MTKSKCHHLPAPLRKNSSSPPNDRKKVCQSLTSATPSLSVAKTIRKEELIDISKAIASDTAVATEIAPVTSKPMGLQLLPKYLKKCAFEMNATVKNLASSSSVPNS